MDAVVESLAVRGTYRDRPYSRCIPRLREGWYPCVEEVLGDESVTGLRIRDGETDEQQDLSCRGVFVAIGHDPETAAFGDLVELDEHGYIKLEGSGSQTTAPGVFACGDVCDPVYKQAVVAAGGGCMAAMDAQHYLEELEGAF